MATTMIEASTHDEVNKAYTFSGKLFDSLVTPRRIQDFTEHHYIVYRKLNFFDDGILDPDRQNNTDESHFIIDLDDGKMLDFRGADKVKNRSIVAGREGITMCVLLRGGSDAKVMCQMLIFKTKKSSYPIQGLLDSVAGAAYRSSPSALSCNNGYMRCVVGTLEALSV
ncbi:hypothetical protein JG688_00003080 [Phytophthora aleatoria]|uniref:Uncharacterized protein n=1 Tax=Phytophthora aleatoria TaxID=2496075 RepID=A0A8J5J290_9STRA|nr:hypothetical protein JG688_00003080 [Phytophthora aleatoria]